MNKEIGNLIQLVDNRNLNSKVTNLLGMNIKKEFMPSVANTSETDLSKYKDLWSGISRMDNVSLNGISYDNSKRIKHRKDIRRKALLAAKDKAQKLAETLDSKIGKPLFIEEERFANSSNNFSNVYADSQPAIVNDGFAPGQIPITVQIKASFELISE